ncbi:MAG: type II toxin-antitoxin system Phd/YefM family antitoxin [Deltaproteobacteria bacterium]|nr:type II toxin-antitoxin system Phd/YefM family antitoxin [Deltaproteobacteria bacterium]
MIKVNIHEAKTHLSQYLVELEQGETILLCKRNHPIAEIHLVPQKPAEPRPIGLAKKVFKVPASFFEELPKEVIALFQGEVS